QTKIVTAVYLREISYVFRPANKRLTSTGITTRTPTDMTDLRFGVRARRRHRVKWSDSFVSARSGLQMRRVDVDRAVAKVGHQFVFTEMTVVVFHVHLENDIPAFADVERRAFHG